MLYVATREDGITLNENESYSITWYYHKVINTNMQYILVIIKWSLKIN